MVGLGASIAGPGGIDSARGLFRGQLEIIQSGKAIGVGPEPPCRHGRLENIPVSE